MSLRIGVIGGSGLYQMEGLSDVREERVTTPFGDPSDALIIGRLGDVELIFLPRHGRGHVYNPTQVNYRANVFALKKLGVSWVVSVSAVGSLREEIVPGDMVVIDQFIDRTRHRKDTFFDDGIVAHVGFADPVCATLRQYLLAACHEVGVTVHDGGCYVNMEGPAFSTRAESHLYRSWGCAVVGMTQLTEARLAREAELSYATLAMSTDYDCWHEGHEDVTVDAVLAVIKKNVNTARNVIRAVVPRIVAHDGPAPQASALAGAIMTAPDRISAERRLALAPLVGKYLS